MLRDLRLATFLFAMLIFSPLAVAADCSSHRLGGSWRTYFLPSAGNWIACELKIGRDGSVKVGSTCRGSRIAKASASGRFSISNCVITGHITAQNRRYVVKHASFNVDQSQMTGVLGLSNGQFVEFTSVKQ